MRGHQRVKPKDRLDVCRPGSRVVVVTADEAKDCGSGDGGIGSVIGDSVQLLLLLEEW